jgi:1-phosphofructokinase family hexose kinase
VILTVTPNPAIDVTYRVDRLVLGEVCRIGTVAERPGGKGVNVARVLTQLGEPVLVTGLSGGPGGAALAADLNRRGIPVDMVDAVPDIRRTLVIQESDGTITSLWEPGRAPVQPNEAARALMDKVVSLLDRARAVVVSGSLPIAMDPELPGQIAAAAAAAGVPALVDVGGAVLQAAARIGGAVLTPNADELDELLGWHTADLASAALAVRQIVAPDGPAPAVVLTRGPDGLAAVLPGATLVARPPHVVDGNPTGAGDAVSAALARHVASASSWDRVDWHEALADAAALSAAAVCRPVAGEIDDDAYRQWRGEVTVEEL